MQKETSVISIYITVLRIKSYLPKKLPTEHEFKWQLDAICLRVMSKVSKSNLMGCCSTLQLYIVKRYGSPSNKTKQISCLVCMSSLVWLKYYHGHVYLALLYGWHTFHGGEILLYYLMDPFYIDMH